MQYRLAGAPTHHTPTPPPLTTTPTATSLDKHLIHVMFVDIHVDFHWDLADVHEMPSGTLVGWVVGWSTCDVWICTGFHWVFDHGWYGPARL